MFSILVTENGAAHTVEVLNPGGGDKNTSEQSGTSVTNLDPLDFSDEDSPEVIHIPVRDSDDDVTVTADGNPVIQPKDPESGSVSGDRQQNGRRVECNGNVVPLDGTSSDNFLVVESPNFPYSYPTYLW